MAIILIIFINKFSIFLFFIFLLNKNIEITKQIYINFTTEEEKIKQLNNDIQLFKKDKKKYRTRK
jgi:hypothetical protein